MPELTQPRKSPTRLDHAAVAGLIPHDGAMVLIDRIEDWGPDFIAAATDSHRNPANPLRRNGCLPAIAALEIAGQAMAAHGRLIGDRIPKRGVLGSLRELRLHVDRLDDIAGPLEVRAELLTGWGRACAYSFRLQAGARVLVEGRAGVFFLFE
jgi:predicted hotdog family 3-hydroxylacyl-ACP dehydratase